MGNAEAVKRYRIRHPERVRDASRRNSKKYYARHREEQLAKARVRDRFLYRYGISKIEREAILVAQGGKCAICEKILDSSRKGLKPHTDHDHKTNEVRGILCQTCNTSLAMIDFVGIEKVRDYLCK